MKFGMRKPSLKRSISARTTGRLKREIKKALIPGYGQKGMGLLHPKKALYNAIYRRTTFSAFDLMKGSNTNYGKGGCCLSLLIWISTIISVILLLHYS